MRQSPRPSFQSSKSSPVIVATDGREQSDGAVRAGARFSESTGQMRLVSAAPLIYRFTPELDWGITAEAIDVLREQQHKSVEDQVRRVLGESVCIDVEIGTGDAAGIVAAVAAKHNASLVISGLGRHRVVDRLLGDETALAIIRASSTPVLAVPQDFTNAPHCAVVGIDFSEASVRAAQVALNLMHDAATVYLINVSPPENVLSVVTGGFAAYEERARAELEVLAGRLDVPPRMHVQPHIRQGDPGSELLHYAEQAHAQLIAVGTRGRGFMARLVLGSVATKVVRASPIPVITNPPTARAPDSASDR
jgi:nucleotide-binding universal stress UspA family protein